MDGKCMVYFLNDRYKSLVRVHENMIIIYTMIIIGDPLETNMPDWVPIRDLEMLHRRPICLIREPLETYMSHRWTKCPINDRHPYGDPSETHMPAESDRNLIHIYIFKYTYFYILFAYLYILEWCKNSY